MRRVHLTDTHLTAEPDSDGERALRARLAALEHVAAADVVVVSGDCSDDGSEESYRRLRDLVDPFARARGAVGVYAMGNHDDRAGFAAVLGDGAGGEADPALPIRSVTRLGNVRVITLDSSVPGSSWGELDAAQLAWLQGQLAQPGGYGTVLVVHHPPGRPLTPIHQGICLQNPHDLAAALAGTDVLLILSGHYHHFLADELACADRTVPVIVGPGIANLNDTLAPVGHERATRGHGACVIDLGPSGPRVQLSLTSSDDVLFDWDPAEVARIARRISAPAR